MLSFGLDILDPELVPTIQISLIGNLGETNIRDIDAKDINRLVSVPGIVISATRTRPKASLIVVKCKRCGNVRRIPVPVGLTTAPIPRICTGQNQVCLHAIRVYPHPPIENSWYIYIFLSLCRLIPIIVEGTSSLLLRTKAAAQIRSTSCPTTAVMWIIRPSSSRK